MNHRNSVGTLVCGTALLVAMTASAQSLGPDFASTYTVRDLGVAGDVAAGYGALHFKANEPSMLLIGGGALAPDARIFQIQVNRDAQNHITGFAATSSVVAEAPGIPPELPLDVEGGIDGGLDYGPGSVLFYTSSSDGAISQIKPGSTSPDKQTRLRDLGIDDPRGGLAFVPPGFPGAGRLKIVNWSSHPWSDTTVASDGAGTYKIAPPGKWVDIVSSATSAAFLKADGAKIPKDSVLVASQLDERAVVYEVDSNGDPIPATLRVLVSDFWVKALTVDPLTGDVLLTSADAFNPHVLLIGRLTAAPTQVRIVSPVEGSTFTGPATFPIDAEASQPGGGISRVDIYVDSTLVGSPAHPPFSALADGLLAGSYTLTSVAFDGGGNATTSAPVHISVANYGPRVTLNYPTNNLMLRSCSDLVLSASVKPGNSEIATVEFFSDATSLGVVRRPWNSQPYTWQEQDLDEGTRVYSVRVVDQNGLTGVSVVTNVVVKPLALNTLVVHHYWPDELRLCFRGNPAGRYVWQSTGNVIGSPWSAWLTNTATAGRIQVTIPFDAGTSQLYYRTRSVD